MAVDRLSEEFNHLIKADDNHAQILFDFTSHSKTFPEAKTILEDLGVEIIETNYLSSNWVLVKLNVKDMRAIALEMIEHGFSIQGINALNFRTV